jgi:hypothetical protein
MKNDIELKEKYKQYLLEEGKKLREMKEKMLKSGWTFVCIEPNIMGYEEFCKNKKNILWNTQKN